MQDNILDSATEIKTGNKIWQPVENRYLKVGDVVKDENNLVWIVQKIAIENDSNDEQFYSKTIYTIGFGDMNQNRRLTRIEISKYQLLTHSGIN